MYTQKLITNLKNGNYKIEMTNECNCSIEWKIVQGELQADIDSDNCWIGNVLSIDGELIAEQIAFESLRTIYLENITTEELIELLEENNLENIIKEMQFNEELEENKDHDEKMKESLINFINDNKYTTYIRYPRNFANEYTCILVDKSIEKAPEDAEEITAKKFAERYLVKDDAVTEYFKGFDLIK
jgi:hypothetical protein